MAKVFIERMKRTLSIVTTAVLSICGFIPTAQASSQFGEPELVWDSVLTRQFAERDESVREFDLRDPETSLEIAGKGYFVGDSELGFTALYEFDPQSNLLSVVQGPNGPIINVREIHKFENNKIVLKILQDGYWKPAVLVPSFGGLTIFDDYTLGLYSEFSAHGNNFVFEGLSENDAYKKLFILRSNEAEPSVLFDPGSIARLQTLEVAEDFVYFSEGFKAIDITDNYLYRVKLDGSGNRLQPEKLAFATADSVEFLHHNRQLNLLFASVYDTSTFDYSVVHINQADFTGTAVLDGLGAAVLDSDGTKLLVPEAFTSAFRVIELIPNSSDPQGTPAFNVLLTSTESSTTAPFLYAAGTRVLWQRRQAVLNEWSYAPRLSEVVAGASVANPTPPGSWDTLGGLRASLSRAYQYLEIQGQLYGIYETAAAAGYELYHLNTADPGDQFFELTASFANRNTAGLSEGHFLTTHAGILAITERETAGDFIASIALYSSGTRTPIAQGLSWIREVTPHPRGAFFLHRSASVSRIFQVFDTELKFLLDNSDFGPNPASQDVDQLAGIGNQLLIQLEGAAKIFQFDSDSQTLAERLGPWNSISTSSPDDWGDYELHQIHGSPDKVVLTPREEDNRALSLYILSDDNYWVIDSAQFGGQDQPSAATTAQDYLFELEGQLYFSTHERSTNHTKINRVTLEDNHATTSQVVANVTSGLAGSLLLPAGAVSGQMILLPVDDDGEEDFRSGLYVFNPSVVDPLQSVSLLPGANRFLRGKDQGWFHRAVTAPLVVDGKLWLSGRTETNTRLSENGVETGFSNIYAITPDSIELAVRGGLSDQDGPWSIFARDGDYVYYIDDSPLTGPELHRVALTTSPTVTGGSDDNEPPVQEVVVTPVAPGSAPQPTAAGVIVTESDLRPGGTISITTQRQLTQARLGSQQLFFSKTDTGYTILLPANLNAASQLTVSLITTSGQVNLTIEPQARARPLDNKVDSVIKRTGNSARVVLYDLVDSGKTQIFVNGKEIAWIRATSNTDPKLRSAPQGHYLVRSFELQTGKNVIEVVQQGERVRRVAYSR